MDALQNLDYPSEKENWMVDILIGSLISMVPIFNFVAMGYIMEAMEMGIRGSRQVPEWHEMGDKFIKGLLMFLITLLYVIVPIILMMVFMVPMFFEAGASGDISSATGIVAVLGVLAGTLLSLAVGFIMPMALARWLAFGSFGEAFRLGPLFAQIKAVFTDYLVAFLLFAFLGAIVMLFASWIPVINLMVYFYWSVAFYNYFGQLYAKACAKPAAYYPAQ